jgi:hypothetical protein
MRIGSPPRRCPFYVATSARHRDLGPELLARRELQDLDLEAVAVHFEPLGSRRVVSAGRLGNGGHVLPSALVLRDRDHVARLQRARRTVAALAVDEDVTMHDDLTRARRPVTEPRSTDGVVEPQLDALDQVRAGVALLLQRAGKVMAELALQQAVDALQALLLTKLLPIRRAALAAPAMHARRRAATLHGALDGEAAFTLQKELHPLAPAQPALRSSGYSSHR